MKLRQHHGFYATISLLNLFFFLVDVGWRVPTAVGSRKLRRRIKRCVKVEDSHAKLPYIVDLAAQFLQPF